MKKIALFGLFITMYACTSDYQRKHIKVNNETMNIDIAFKIVSLYEDNNLFEKQRATDSLSVFNETDNSFSYHTYEKLCIKSDSLKLQDIICLGENFILLIYDLHVEFINIKEEERIAVFYPYNIDNNVFLVDSSYSLNNNMLNYISYDSFCLENVIIYEASLLHKIILSSYIQMIYREYLISPNIIRNGHCNVYYCTFNGKNYTELNFSEKIFQ